MANIVVTSSAKSVKAEFNGLSSAAKMEVGYFSKEHIATVIQVEDGFIEIAMDDGKKWPISFKANPDALIVDSVDGVVPTSNEHLLEMIAAFIDY